MRDQLFLGLQPVGFVTVFGLSAISPQLKGAHGDVFVGRQRRMNRMIVVMVFHGMVDGLRAKMDGSRDYAPAVMATIWGLRLTEAERRPSGMNSEMPGPVGQFAKPSLRS